MTEPIRIADQLKRSVRGIAWHGPSVMEILADVTAEEAVQHPVADAHSIAEIVLHVTAWLRAAERGLSGTPTQLSSAEDWPGVPAAFDWAEALEQLRDASKALGDRIKRLDADDLERLVRGNDQDYSTYALLHGVVQHNLYHAGQLALLKKAIRTL